MKKSAILISLVLFFMAINTNMAQNKIRFGLKTGLNAGTLSSPDEWYSINSGFSIGAFGKYQLMESLNVSFEPTYDRSGASKVNPLDIHYQSELVLNDVYGIPYSKHNLTFSKLQFPLLINYNLKAGGVGLYIIAGASFNMLLSSSHDFYKEDVKLNDSWLGSATTSLDVTDRFTSYEIPAIVGLGTMMSMGKIDLYIDLRYQHGFMNINNVANKPDLLTRYLSLNISIGVDKFLLK